jgi:hypothetical protein
VNLNFKFIASESESSWIKKLKHAAANLNFKLAHLDSASRPWRRWPPDSEACQ